MVKDLRKHRIEMTNWQIVRGNDILEILGMLLFNERWFRNKTVWQVSRYSGVHEKTIDEIEIARCKPHWEGIIKLLRYYNKRVEVRLVDRE